MTVYDVEKNIRQGFPYSFRCRVFGKYDEKFYGTSPNYINKLYSDLTDYDGFNYTAERKVLVNVSQVNNPTISDDGVVSDFAAAKYVYCSDNTIVFTSPWRLTVKFTTGSTVTSANNNIVGCNVDTYGIRLGWGSSDRLFFFLVSDPANGGWITTTEHKGTYVVQPNTTYWYRIGWDGSNYYGQYSLDGTTFTNDISYASTTTPTYNTYPFRLGNNGANSSYPMTGSIDLKECKMETPSQFFPDAWGTVWSGIQSTQTVVYDFSNTVLPWKWDYKNELQTSKYILDTTNQTKTYYGNSINGTINGTLTTIRAYTPRMSGFSGSNYLTIPTAFMPASNTWEIVWKMRTTTLNSQQYFFGSSTDYFRTVGGELNSSNKFGCGISSNGTSWDIGWLSGATTWEANTWYWVKISFTGTMYKLELSTDGENWNLENSRESSTPIYQDSSRSIMFLGTMGSRATYWHGDIDLKECYIKIGDTIWWRGIKKETVPSMSYGKTIGTTNNVYVINGNESLSAESTSVTRTTDATNPRFLGTVTLVQ